MKNNYFANYVYDTTFHVTGNDPNKVVSKIKAITAKLFTWFSQNYMKTKFDKGCMLLNTSETLRFKIVKIFVNI